MREIFVHQDSVRVGFYKSILEEAGILAFIRNELSNNSLTEMPSGIFFPTLCVVNDDDFDRAMELLRDVYKPAPSSLPDWHCEQCGEEIPGGFEICWKCGAEASGERTASSAVTATMPVASGGVGSHDDIRAAAKILRCLVLASATLEVFWWLGSGMFTVTPPAEVARYLGGLGHGQDMDNIANASFYVRSATWAVTLPLAFGLARIARPVAMISLFFYALSRLGSYDALYPPVSLLLCVPKDMLVAAIILMMYTPPLRQYFSSMGKEGRTR